jgi:integrase
MAGQLIQRGKERFVVRVFLGRDGGKRRYVNRTVHGRRRDAERVLRDLLAARDRGDLVTPSRQSLGDFLRRWLDDYAAGAVAETTLASYRATVRVHLAPAFGAVPLRHLSPAPIQRHMAEKLAAGLSPKTVAYHRTILREALAHAVKWGLLSRNPADTTDAPRVARREMRVWDEEQARVFLGEAKRVSPYYRLYLAALLTGARQGELLGLRWEGFDAAFGRLAIQRTLYRLGGRLLIKEPKTAKARRTIPLPASLAGELQALRAEQEERRRTIGDCPSGLECRVGACPHWHEFGLIFCQPNGKPLHAHNVARRDFRRVLTRAGLPRVRFHDLRHLCATLLLSQGVHPKVAQELLGHSTVSVTLDTYSHVAPALAVKATRTLETRLLGSKAPVRSELVGRSDN